LWQGVLSHCAAYRGCNSVGWSERPYRSGLASGIANLGLIRIGFFLSTQSARPFGATVAPGSRNRHAYRARRRFSPAARIRQLSAKTMPPATLADIASDILRVCSLLTTCRVFFRAYCLNWQCYRGSGPIVPPSGPCSTRARLQVPSGSRVAERRRAALKGCERTNDCLRLRRHVLPMRGNSHLIICRYGSPLDGIRSIAFLAKGLACSSVCRLSFGSDIHSRMIFRRVSCSGLMLRFLCSKRWSTAAYRPHCDD